MRRGKIFEIYEILFSAFGPQNWWPGETPFEVAIGAILTQNTSWQNVEYAILNLKKAKCLSLRALATLPQARLKKLIKPAGYYNVKAARIRNFLRCLKGVYRGSMSYMAAQKTAGLRDTLLSVKGIGEETADSILLYALSKPIFVVDAYTRRISERHGLIKGGADYAALQSLYMEALPKKIRVFNEYHALLVKLGKDYCRKGKPNCSVCPLHGI